MPIPPEVKSTVAFVFLKDEKGKMIPNGTGFFVGVKNPSDPNKVALYFVTAKHVIQKPGTTEFRDNIHIRMNKRNGGIINFPLPLNFKGMPRIVYFHRDLSVDLAVINMEPNQELLDFKYIPSEMITSKEEYKKLSIREGSDIFFTGLFLPYYGAERNYPVVRFGRVALVTEEQIEWNGELMDLYLIEIGAFGGNSGSPVFFYLGSDREPGSVAVGNPVLKLAGVMKGTFFDSRPVKEIEVNKKSISFSSMGIAAVVPGYKLHEILHGDELKQKRGF
jgi:hypothetical protein